MSIADLRPDTARELNDQRFYGHQRTTLGYVQSLYDRLRARRPGNRLPADHPQRPAAEEASIAEMKRFGDRLSELAAEAWLPGVEHHDITGNDGLHDALCDAIEVAEQHRPIHHWIDGQRYTENGADVQREVLTEEVEIDLQKYGIDLLNREYRLRISRDDFEGEVVCKLAGMRDENTAIYAVAFCD